MFLTEFNTLQEQNSLFKTGSLFVMRVDQNSQTTDSQTSFGRPLRSDDP